MDGDAQMLPGWTELDDGKGRDIFILTDVWAMSKLETDLSPVFRNAYGRLSLFATG